MSRTIPHLALSFLLVAIAAASALAQQRAPAPAPAPAEQPKPLTRADKAHKMFSDAHSLQLTGRPLEAAALYESLAKQHPTGEQVPEALARAASIYAAAGQQDKADVLVGVLRKNFANCQYTLSTYWVPAERACARDSKVPMEKRIALLEEYLDRYWAQANFGQAIEMLSESLLAAGQIADADALLSHALTETSDEGMGHIINMIQRGTGNRKDYANQAKIWGDATRNMATSVPAWPVVRLLEIRYLILAESFDDALQRSDALIKDRPKSDYAAYAALEVKPSIFAKQKNPAEAAAALRQAIEAYGVFSLPRHSERLADYEAEAANLPAAIDILTRLLAQPMWPWEQHALLNKKHDLQIKAGTIDAAIATNQEIERLFPRSRVALSAALRTASNLMAAQRFGEAKAALSQTITDYKNHAMVAELILPYADRFGAANPAEAKAVREELIAAFPASLEADTARKALGVPTDGTPTAQAQAVLAEYSSFAKENNVEAAQRRIDKLFAEFPSSSHGAGAAIELGDALKKAEKVEMAADLYFLLADKAPYHRLTEDRLFAAGKAYSGVARPDKALPAYQKLVSEFRSSRDWRSYVMSAASTLSAQDKHAEAKACVASAARSIGGGPNGADLEAYVARRLEDQEKWGEAADEMLRILGDNAANPAYRPLIGQAFRLLVVSGQKDKEARLLENLANRYDDGGWDEADRIRISLSSTYARSKQAAKAVKLLEEIQNRHQKYEIGACGEPMLRHLSKWTNGLFHGTVGYHPVDRVANDMSGGYGNYLYAHRAEHMIDYALLLNEPQAYVDRVKAMIPKLLKAATKRPTNYRSGIPYRTKNILRPQSHPLPEQRRIYNLVNALDEGLRRMNQRADAALWLEVYPLWPNHYLNDERITAAARVLYGRDNALFQKALAILKEKYSELTWAPYVLAAQAGYERNNGSRSEAAKLYQTIATRYPDHELAASAAQTAKDLSGRG